MGAKPNPRSTRNQSVKPRWLARRGKIIIKLRSIGQRDCGQCDPGIDRANRVNVIHADLVAHAAGERHCCSQVKAQEGSVAARATLPRAIEPLWRECLAIIEVCPKRESIQSCLTGSARVFCPSGLRHQLSVEGDLIAKYVEKLPKNVKTELTFEVIVY